MVKTEEQNIDIDFISKQYSSLLKEARKEAREAAEEAPRRTKKEISVKGNTIHWEVKTRRNPFFFLLLFFLSLFLAGLSAEFAFPQAEFGIEFGIGFSLPQLVESSQINLPPTVYNSLGFRLLILFWPFLLLFPFFGVYKTWTKGSIPLPREVSL